MVFGIATLLPEMNMTSPRTLPAGELAIFGVIRAKESLLEVMDWALGIRDSPVGRGGCRQIGTEAEVTEQRQESRNFCWLRPREPQPPPAPSICVINPWNYLFALWNSPDISKERVGTDAESQSCVFSSAD